ncbi:flagellar basal body-associated protein FliL [Litoreibacter ponti]|uniref:Flagellar protein FliL n=1 Tax=Litoreibacter ponti TaxID=1510457 RepID=A0A2T6BNB1_9RHOB|nr:flagellar basal body-associated FliL family protein [Litoreibacter ponti]PTX57570.1 flagellar basal body-associated protein FliL [Litoreibacter ponti]
MSKILPILMLLIGLGAGVGAGLALRPPPVEPEVAVEEQPDETDAEEEVDLGTPGATPEEPGYVKMNNQFIVPVIEKDKVVSLVVLSITLETDVASTEDVYSREPKLRDAFLQDLFDHAYLGGFSGVYTSSNMMDTLRASLLRSSRRIVGETVTKVLITDIVRQDL